MVNTILLSLFFSSFLAERFYFYIYHNTTTEPLLNFNPDMHQPLNFDQNISNNTNITEYVINNEDRANKDNSVL